MPEGHVIHRLAVRLDEQFAGRQVGVSSPQGRFAAAAELLDGTRLVGSDAVGKHLLIEATVSTAFAATLDPQWIAR